MPDISFAGIQVGWEAWYTAAVIIALVTALIKEVARPDIVLLSCIGLLLLGGVVPPDIAFGGFSNPAVLTIASLFVVAAGIQRTDALAVLDRLLFATRRVSRARMMLRLMSSTAAISALVNNTPLVAMLMPRLQKWGEREQVAASKLMMPLSYAAVLGGMVTLIGTSTNLVVSGVLHESTGTGFGMFDLTWVGLPAAVLGILYFSFVGHRALPQHRAANAYERTGAEYRFELKIATGAAIAGRTVEEAELRALHHAFLTHVRRGEHMIAPVTPQEVLQEGDVLAFTGDTAVMDHLLERSGFERAVNGLPTDGLYRLPLFEAVIASASSLVGRTLKEADFRNRFQGVVLAIQRRDEEIKDSLGSVRLKPGDLLVIEARNSFYERWKSRREEFYLVAPVRGTIPAKRRRKAPVALALFAAMVTLSALDIIPLVSAAFVAALGMIATRCLHLREAREEIDIPILIMIAAAIGIGATIEETGLAAVFGQGLVSMTEGAGLLVTLAVIYLATNILTELLTNSASAALMAPIAIAAAAGLGVSPIPFAIAVAIAASAGFATPFGYQTHLMVMGAGGYRVKDFFRAGIPLNLIVMVVALIAIWLVWL